MKKSLALVALLSTGAAFADASTTVSANVFGVLKVETTAAEAIIAVPWLEPSVNGANIAVTNVLMTANLNAGDELYYYDLGTKSYKTWQLDANKKWEPAQLVVENATVSAGDGQTLARGNAILLKRTGTPANCIYLQGQVATNATATVTMAKGTDAAAAYTLLAPPAAAETDLNTGATWTGVCDGDFILLSNFTMLTYDAEKGGWGKDVKNLVDRTVAHTTSFAKIPAGQGAWYQSVKGAATAATVTWNNLPSVQ